MTLKDNLYSIESCDMAGATFTVRLIAGSPIFRAHFPGMPVMPGVCIISVATELTPLLLGAPARLTEVVNAKFLAVINPEATPRLTYSFSRLSVDDISARLTATVSDGTTTFARLSLIFSL